MRRRVAIAAMVTLTACTPAQVRQWVEWHNADPTAAEAFANQPDIQAQLTAPQAPAQRAASVATHNGGVTTNNHAAAWERIAYCESGGNWHLRASNNTGTYGGGLMIRDNVWRAYGGTRYAPTADQASKAQQITIAERILADVGWKAWDCA